MFFKKKKIVTSDVSINKYADTNKKFDTTKIDLDNFNLDKTEHDLISERYARLTVNELKSKLENSNLSKIEKQIIQQMINDKKI
ncbi:MAG: hypothetical protein RSE95_00270 [Malacoplasma sp.]